LKPSCNGWGLPKAHSKDELIKLVKQTLSLQPDYSVIDLDLPSNQHACPPDSDLGVWLDTWHLFVDILGSSDDAEVGIRAARLFLFEISTKCASMLFSADASKPPLDQFGSPGKCLELLFNESSCYTNIRPIAIYKGRKVYLGTEPSSTKSYIP
jgi:hypothetical protein